jgi:hypothetical protein
VLHISQWMSLLLLLLLSLLYLCRRTVTMAYVSPYLTTLCQIQWFISESYITSQSRVRHTTDRHNVHAAILSCCVDAQIFLQPQLYLTYNTLCHIVWPMLNCSLGLIQYITAKERMAHSEVH